MDQTATPPANAILDWAAPAVLDAILVAAYTWGVPQIARWLAQPHWAHALVILGAYVAMCVGVVMARSIESTGPATGQKARDADKVSGCALGVSLPYCAFVLMLLFLGSGMLSDGPSPFNAIEHRPGGENLLVVIGTVIAFLVFGLFPWSLLHQPRQTIPATGPQAWVVRGIALLLANTMLLVSAAYFTMEFSGLEPMHLALAGRILVFIFAYAFFLVFYTPPRLALMLIAGNRQSLWTLLGATAVIVWPLTK